MTGPLGGKAGDAFVEWHADTAPMVRETEEGFAEIEAIAEVEGETIGRTLGGSIGEGVKKEVHDQGPSIAREIEQAIEKEEIAPKPKFSLAGLFGFGKGGSSGGGRNRSQTREVVRGIENVVEDAADGARNAVEAVGRTLGQTLVQGIGAIFNVGGGGGGGQGGGALIAFLVPVFAELGVLIGGLVEALGPLLALLTTLPAVIGGIALSVGVLFLAFHGLGTAIQGAFAAKNAKELDEALKGLTPSAKAFVKELLNARDVIKQLSQDAQQAFFAPLAGKLTALVHDLSILFHGDLEKLASSLGGFFAGFADFLNSPAMKAFLTDLFPATERWIEGFGKGLVDLLTGLLDLARASLPFLSTVGADLNSVFSMLGAYFTKLSKDPKFRDWLDRMAIAFDSLLGVLKAAGIFIAAFLDALDKAGGETLLTTLAEQLQILAWFFETQAGQEGLKGFITLLIGLGDSFIGLIIVIVFVTGAITAFVEWLTGTAAPNILEFFQMLGEAVVYFLSNIDKWVGDWFTFLGEKIKQGVDNVIGWFEKLFSWIGDFFSNIGSWLYNAGRDLIVGFWNGIKSTGTWLKDQIMDWVRRNIPEPVRIALGIHSPSTVMADLGKQAASGFSLGFGDQFQQDAKALQGLMGGFGGTDVGVNTTSQNVAFGPGAVQVNFNGQMPTMGQAQAVGAAVGMGINEQLAARNARLAVRTL